MRMTEFSVNDHLRIEVASAQHSSSELRKNAASAAITNSGLDIALLPDRELEDMSMLPEIGYAQSLITARTMELLGN